MAHFGPNFIVEFLNWADLKAMVAYKVLKLQYSESDPLTYEVFAIDGPLIYTTTIYKGEVPYNWYIDQTQNDADKTDFETNYKPTANQPLDVKQREFQTFLLAGNGAPGNGKSMCSIFNASGSGKILRLHELWVRNVQGAAVTGVIAQLQVSKITGHSGGILLTPIPHDSADSLHANVTCRSGSAVQGEGSMLNRWFLSTDEWTVGTLDLEGFESIVADHFPLYRHVPGGQKPITLREGEGIHLKCATNTNVGSLDMAVIFTQE